jgi:hypothetical protein
LNKQETIMRPRNAAFQCAIAGLTHPLTIIAIVVLLTNDHWLRWQHPSWLTGKLGDFVWLIFAPFIAALFFSWLIPRRLKQHEQFVGIISFSLIGLWFILGKTEPNVHRLTVSLLETLMNWHDTLRMDSSDLLMLPGLLVGWWIWRHSHETRLTFRPSAHVVFALAIMATLANSPAPANFGLGCIAQRNDELIVSSEGNYYLSIFYSSEDGGIIWTPLEINNEQVQSNLREECFKRWLRDDFTVIDPANQNIQYRFQAGQSIERSDDGGQTWTIDLDLSELNPDVRRYYHSRKVGEVGANVAADPGPFDAVFDQTSGNLVVSMGFDGMLVHPPNGEWNWISIGPYHRENIYRFDRLPDLLKIEFILAVVLTLLIIGLHLQPRLSGCAAPAVALIWVLWVIGVMFPPPKWNDGSFINPVFFTFFTTMFVLLIAPILVVSAVGNAKKQKIVSKQVKETVLLALGSGVLFLFPYLLWSQGTIPTYSSASVFGLMLGLAAVVGCGEYLKRKYPPVIETPPLDAEVID